jgi:hypothetical protein
MKKYSLTLAVISMVVACSMLLTGCGWLVTVKDTGPLTTRDFEFTDFSSIEVGSAFRVDISPSDDHSVRITANESLFKDIRVVQEDNTLKIGLAWPGISFGNRTLKASITLPELAGLKLSGASKGTVRGFASAKNLGVRISGASSLDLDVETGDFVSEISGSSEMTARVKSSRTDITLSGGSSATLDIAAGDFVYESSGASEGSGSIVTTGTTIRLTGACEIRLTGTGGNLFLTGSGASNCKLAGLNINNADISLSGASYADVDVDGRLNISLSGASELRYEGNPVFGERMDISGGSTLEPR